MQESLGATTPSAHSRRYGLGKLHIYGTAKTFATALIEGAKK
jgi:hypothetical protein